jgi:hypothetical protein
VMREVLGLRPLQFHLALLSSHCTDIYTYIGCCISSYSHSPGNSAEIWLRLEFHMESGDVISCLYTIYSIY